LLLVVLLALCVCQSGGIECLCDILCDGRRSANDDVITQLSVHDGSSAFRSLRTADQSKRVDNDTGTLSQSEAGGDCSQSQRAYSEAKACSQSEQVCREAGSRNQSEGVCRKAQAGSQSEQGSNGAGTRNQSETRALSQSEQFFSEIGTFSQSEQVHGEAGAHSQSEARALSQPERVCSKARAHSQSQRVFSTVRSQSEHVRSEAAGVIAQVTSPSLILSAHADEMRRASLRNNMSDLVPALTGMIHEFMTLYHFSVVRFTVLKWSECLMLVGICFTSKYNF